MVSARIDNNSFYFAFTSYLIFQDFTEQMIGKIIFISNLNHKVPIFSNDCLLLLKDVRQNYFDIRGTAWHRKALQWRQHDKLCRTSSFRSSKFCNAFSKFFGMFHTLLSFIFELL